MKTAPESGRPSRRGERRRDALWLALGVLFSAALLFAADREADRQESLRLEAFRAQTIDLARIAESIIDGELRSLDDALLVLRDAYSGDLGHFADTLRLLRSGSLANRELLVVLVDRDGYLAFTDTPAAVPRLYLGDRKYFRFFAEGGRDDLYIDEPGLGRVTGRQTLPVVRPVYDKRGGFLGVIAISLPQQTLVQFIPRLHLSGDTTITVVHHGGAVVSHLNDPALAQAKILPAEQLAPMFQGTEGIYSSRAAPDRAERFIAYRHIHNERTPLIVAAAASPAGIRRETAQQRALLLGGAGFTALVIMVLTAVFLKGRRTTAELIDTLRSSKKREYEALTGTTLDGFLIVDDSRRILDVNDTCCTMLGYEREELLSLRREDIVTGEAPDQAAAHLRTVLAAGSDRFQSRWRRKDGSIIDVEISIQLLSETNGRFFIFARDITERKQAAESLRENEEKYRSLFQNASIGIFHSLPEGRFLRVNPALAAMLRYASPEEMIAAITNIGTQIYIDSKKHPNVLAATLESSEWVHTENRYRRKDGTVLTANLSIRKVLRRDGTLDYLEGFVEDLTERKQSEESLRKSQELLNETGRLAKIGGWAIDLAGGTLEWTRGTYLIHELDSAFVPTVAAALAFYTPESRPLIRRAVELAIRQGEAFDLELEMDTATGRRIWVQAIGRANFHDGGARTVSGTIQDITLRKQAEIERGRLATVEDQLRQSQKVEAIGRLAGGVAHDFNNITAIILGYGEMLLNQLRPADPARKWAEQIVAAGRRSTALTRQLLAFSRKQTLMPVVLDVNDLLRNFEKMLGRVIGEDIELKFNLAADPGRVKADAGQLEQVVTNLAFNARDAMPLGGSLTIETAEVELDEVYALGHESVVPGRYVMLALTDTGCGMDKATMARLFEPFFTTKPQGRGTGLGLATSYGIVKQSGGYIWGYSEVGKGTTFKIFLPRTEEQAHARTSAASAELPLGRGQRILLVEDEVPLRELCEMVLTRLGYRVDAAGSGAEALLLVQERRFEPDLVLTDVIMPGMSGAELARQLRRDRPDLSVLYMSGYPDDAIAPHGVLDPGTRFMQKPFSERVLAEKVREALHGTAAAPAGKAGETDPSAA